MIRDKKAVAVYRKALGEFSKMQADWKTESQAVYMGGSEKKRQSQSRIGRRANRRHGESPRPDRSGEKAAASRI